MLECFVCISALAFVKKINDIYSYHEMFGTHVIYNNEKKQNGITSQHFILELTTC